MRDSSLRNKTSAAIVPAPPGTAPAKRRKAARRQPRPRLSKAEIVEIFARFARINPEPKGELEHVNLYTLLVAVVLSAQATDAGVNRATRALFKVADTPQKMVALGEDQLRGYIKTIGLYRNKAKNVIALSQRLIMEFGGEVPRDRDTLETLPGVGRKTANVVMNVWFNEPTMAVDTHVLRVSNRIGLVRAKTPLDAERQLLRVIPPEYGVPAHHWLILHGRYLCKARKPECWRCPIADLCRFPDKSPPPGTRLPKVGS
ncbi:MAG: endonuclease III [Hyphomicrobiaceae bacterium]